MDYCLSSMQAFSQPLPLLLLLLLALTAAECAIANGCREVPLSGRAVAALAAAGTSIHAGPLHKVIIVVEVRHGRRSTLGFLGL